MMKLSDVRDEAPAATSGVSFDDDDPSEPRPEDGPSSFQQHPSLKSLLRRAKSFPVRRHGDVLIPPSAAAPEACGNKKQQSEGTDEHHSLGASRRGNSYDDTRYSIGPTSSKLYVARQRRQSMMLESEAEAYPAGSSTHIRNAHGSREASGQQLPFNYKGFQQLQESLAAELNTKATGEELPFNDEPQSHQHWSLQQSLETTVATRAQNNSLRAWLPTVATQCPYQALTAASFRISSCLMRFFDVPMCHVSLLGEERVWFPTKSVLKDVPGMPVDEHPSCGLQSCCNYALVPTEPEVVLVEDTEKDPTFHMSPFVTGRPHIRFFAGAPLVGKGKRRYGTLSIMDTRPRSFNAATFLAVIQAAEQVVKEIESSQEVLDELAFRAFHDKRNDRKLQHCIASSAEPVAFMDIRGEAWDLIYCNQSFSYACGAETAELMSKGFLGTFEPSRQSWKAIARTLGNNWTVQTKFRCKVSGEELRLELRPANSDHMALPDRLGPPSDGIAPPGSVCKDAKLTGNLCKCFVFVIVLQTEKPEDSQREENEPLDKPFAFTSDGVPEDLKGLLTGPLLGSGPLHTVYLGKFHNSKVAVKVIDAVNNKKVSKSEAEALLGLSISHPNVVKTMFFSQQKTALWIVQEFCDKGMLIQAIERGEFHQGADDTKGVFLNPNMQLIVHTLHAIADGLLHLHGQGIMHSALSGRTILLKTSDDESDTGGFVPKLADFNLLRTADIPSSTLFDDPAHLAPEVLKDGVESESADVWSFGILMWEMYMGLKAFGNKKAGLVVWLVMNDKERMTLPQSAPLAYRMIMNSCLRRDPEDRPDFETLLVCLKDIKDVQQPSNSGTAT